MATRIGVIGGYGAVGRATVETLASWGVGPIRIGGRDKARAAALAEEVGADAVQIDVWDSGSLAAFCQDVDVVVSCAGPSYQVGDRVARAAIAGGADYVDPGGDHQLVAQLEDAELGRGRVVVNAGLMPGLTAVLPRWLSSNGFRRVHRALGYVAIVDRLTPVGAKEYLLTLGHAFGESRAVWRGGRRLSRALEPQAEVVVPFLDGVVALFPYLSAETERTAIALGLHDVDWYTVFDGGGNMFRALSRLHAVDAGALDDAATQLTNAAALDLFGRTPYQVIAVQLEGVDAVGDPLTRSLVYRSTDTYAVTGAVCALAVRAVLDDRVPPGAHLLEDCMDADDVVETLDELAVGTRRVVDEAIDRASWVEEGVL